MLGDVWQKMYNNDNSSIKDACNMCEGQLEGKWKMQLYMKMTWNAGD